MGRVLLTTPPLSSPRPSAPVRARPGPTAENAVHCPGLSGGSAPTREASERTEGDVGGLSTPSLWLGTGTAFGHPSQSVGVGARLCSNGVRGCSQGLESRHERSVMPTVKRPGSLHLPGSVRFPIVDVDKARRRR